MTYGNVSSARQYMRDKHVISGRAGVDDAYRFTCSRQRNLDLTASAHI